MRTVDDFARIRQALRDGLSAREAAKQLGVSRDTVRKAQKHAEPPGYTVSEPRPAPVFGPFHSFVDEILAADKTAPWKQRHTAAQIHRRLVAEKQYRGGYDQVRRYLQQKRLDRRETFIPLEHRPGARAEADFGHIHVDFPDGRRQVPILIVTWSYSNAPFAIALPTERTEAILHGMVEAFAFFECVPVELWWDRPKTVAIHILQGRERTMHPRYAALASHYRFTPKFCLPRAATEKPRVENRVFDVQRQWATPVPRVTDFAELNEHLRRCCLAARERTCGDNTVSVGVRFEEDRAAALAIPPHPFDACVTKPGQVDKYQTAPFDGNRYSVPRRWAFRLVTVKGYVDRVAIVADNQVIATHRRSYGRHEKVLAPLHFLGVLERKPAALDHAPVYRDWQLPAAFVELRRDFEGRLGKATGARQFIRVLQLLDRHSMGLVERVILATGPSDAPAIVAAVERMACDNAVSVDPLPATNIAVPLPDLSLFDRLLPHSSNGVNDHERCQCTDAQGQPEAVAAADDAGRVGETGP
ncbi:MAG TPA: IS21 family transposase [Urbifossiella sp.]|nr:IS21 family transposase [Urbifossiella sp.]